jgi:type III restriction enzyme
MAALILDLYRHGYRNFLFFVNSGQIIETTKENFLNPASAKHLIAPIRQCLSCRSLARRNSEPS